MKKIYFAFAFLFTFGVLTASGLCAGEFVEDDDPQVNDNGYIMSWLILDPYINGALTSIPALNEDYFEDQDGEANIMPREGDVVEIAADGAEHEWVKLNFADLKDMGKIGAPVGGNELDILDWGGQVPTNTQTYLVTYLKWSKATTVTFTFGSDDSSESFFNGEQLHSFPADIDWGAANGGSHEVSVKGGEWNILVVGAYETSGEWGISVKVDPIPDEVDSSGPEVLFAVEPASKLSTTWGMLKK